MLSQISYIKIDFRKPQPHLNIYDTPAYKKARVHIFENLLKAYK